MGNLSDRVKGLKLGADDYIVKPFETVELLARIDAEKLLHLVWGYEYLGETRTVDVHIQKLRKKIKLGKSNKDGI